MTNPSRLLCAAALFALLLLPAEAADAGAVYVMTNDATANSVLVYHRAADGLLAFGGSFGTGGSGTGVGLGSQGALALSEDHRFLYAVNAASDSISVFSVTESGLDLGATVASGGRNPISVAVGSRRLYVLNAGGTVGDADRIVGFRIGSTGALTPIPDGASPLSEAATNPAQVGFGANDSQLVVTEKGTSRIDILDLDRQGRPHSITTIPSAGTTPFGFDVGRRDHLIVSEAFGGAIDASAVSSYALEDRGEAAVVDPSVGTTETAACWVVVTPDGRFAYATNTGSGSITGYAVGFDGSLTLLDGDGVTAETGAGSAPIDVDLSSDARFLYNLNAGSGTVTGFSVRTDGGLDPIDMESGVPLSATGLVAR
jgi:6-phosphogluconolactonase (cycloisomerase 2 family)